LALIAKALRSYVDSVLFDAPETIDAMPGYAVSAPWSGSTLPVFGAGPHRPLRQRSSAANALKRYQKLGALRETLEYATRCQQGPVAKPEHP